MRETTAARLDEFEDALVAWAEVITDEARREGIPPGHLYGGSGENRWDPTFPESEPVSRMT